MAKSQELKNAYFHWLMEEYTFSDLDKNVVKIGTPFLDADFDYITMYAVFMQNGKIKITDDGWTLNNLENYGLSFNGRSKHRNQLLTDITNSLGVTVLDKELSITTDLDKFPLAKQRLLQAIMQVNDLAVLQNKNVKSIFFEEIEAFLNQNDVLYVKRPSFAGKEGITVQFDFSVPTKKSGEQLIRTISNGNELNRAKLLAIDTRLLSRTKSDARYIALIDDETHPFSKRAETEAIFEENTTSKILTLPKSELYKKPELLTNVI